MKKIMILIGCVCILSLIMILNNDHKDRIVNDAGYPSWNSYYNNDKELVEKSTLIGTGKVTGQETEMIGDLVFTYYTITFDEFYKKPESIQKNKVKVLLTGGIYENYETLPFEECPLLEKNRNYLFFLEDTPTDHYLIAGGYQGIATIKNNTISFRNQDAQKIFSNIQNQKIMLLKESIK